MLKRELNVGLGRVFKNAMWAIKSAKASCLLSRASVETSCGDLIDSKSAYKMSLKMSWFSTSVYITKATGTKYFSLLWVSADLFKSSEEKLPD